MSFIVECEDDTRQPHYQKTEHKGQGHAQEDGLLSFSSFRLAQRNEKHKLKSIANIDIVFYLVYIYIYFFFVSLPFYFFTFL